MSNNSKLFSNQSILSNNKQPVNYSGNNERMVKLSEKLTKISVN